MTFEVVGECYVHGFMYGESLLGPLPAPWRARKDTGSTGSFLPLFWNSETDSESREDPRLEDLPAEWEKIEEEQWAPEFVGLYFPYSPHRNTVTGEEIVSDPRMFPEALKARGVRLEEFTLV
jgi:hypothetical protein